MRGTGAADRPGIGRRGAGVWAWTPPARYPWRGEHRGRFLQSPDPTGSFWTSTAPASRRETTSTRKKRRPPIGSPPTPPRRRRRCESLQRGHRRGDERQQAGDPPGMGCGRPSGTGVQGRACRRASPQHAFGRADPSDGLVTRASPARGAGADVWAYRVREGCVGHGLTSSEDPAKRLLFRWWYK